MLIKKGTIVMVCILGNFFLTIFLFSTCGKSVIEEPSLTSFVVKRDSVIKKDTTKIDPPKVDTPKIDSSLIKKYGNFKIYSWIRYTNTPGNISYDTLTQTFKYFSLPDLSSEGLYPFFLIAPTALFDNIPGTTSTDQNNTRGIINENKIKGVAQAIFAKDTSMLVQLDAEAWSFSNTGDATDGPVGNINKTKDSFIKTIAIFKKYNTKSKIGFYASFPINRYTYNKIATVAQYQTWQQQNDILKEAYIGIDIFFPSCYTREVMADSLQWKQYAIACINEIKRLAPGKPIIVGLSLQYQTGGSGILNEFVEPEYVQYQLEVLLLNGADGAFFWTSNKDKDGNTIAFNKTMPWFNAVQQFRQKYKTK